MILLEDIWSCNNCPLGEHCAVTPLGYERSGSKVDVMCIVSGPVHYKNDYNQEVVTGINRTGLLKTLNQHTKNWYLTRLVKCQPKNSNKTYGKKIVTECQKWVHKEMQEFDPKCIIAFGKQAMDYLSVYSRINFFPNLNNTLSNKNYMKKLNELLSGINNA